MQARTFAQLAGSLAARHGLRQRRAERAAGAEPESASQGAPISGMYNVSGVTTETASGHQRKLSGTIILAEEGPRYTATFNLTTTYPGGDESLPAEVIGKGEGTVEGRTLKGTSHTQLVVATVPGVDPGFAYIPRMVSTRIVSTSVTKIAPDGSVADRAREPPEGGRGLLPDPHRADRKARLGRRLGSGRREAGLEPASEARSEPKASEGGGAGYARAVTAELGSPRPSSRRRRRRTARIASSSTR